MKRIDELVAIMQASPQGIKFKDLTKFCDYYFGKSRQVGSHIIYKTPWPGDPRINIQKDGKEAKKYQIKQVLLAINKLKEMKNDK